MMPYALYSALLSGALFGSGLVISGMTQPKNVIAFLDFFGEWDPRLVFVMVGAIGVYSVIFHSIKKCKKPFFADVFQLPTRKDLDRDLLIGSATFGIGWGVGGFCPGPALASLSTGAVPVLVFLGAMTLGMFLRGKS